MKRKYKNVKIEYKWIKFDSKKEASRYMDLEILQRAWEIQDLETQPKFLLQDCFKYRGKTIRSIYYISDFMYKKDWKIHVEDVKWMKTGVYNIKKKLFLKEYGWDIIFLET